MKRLIDEEYIIITFCIFFLSSAYAQSISVNSYVDLSSNNDIKTYYNWEHQQVINFKKYNRKHKNYICGLGIGVGNNFQDAKLNALFSANKNLVEKISTTIFSVNKTIINLKHKNKKIVENNSFKYYFQIVHGLSNNILNNIKEEQAIEQTIGEVICVALIRSIDINDFYYWNLTGLAPMSFEQFKKIINNEKIDKDIDSLLNKYKQ